MGLNSKEIETLKVLMENGEMYIGDILNNGGSVESIESLEQKGLIDKTFRGQPYREDKYAIAGINKEWQECLQNFFEK